MNEQSKLAKLSNSTICGFIFLTFFRGRYRYKKNSKEKKKKENDWRDGKKKNKKGYKYIV